MSSFLVISHAMLWAVVVLLVVLFLVTARQIGLLYRRLPPFGARMGLPGPELRDVAPDVDAIDVLGERTTLGTHRGNQTLLIFTSPTCSACEELGPAIRTVSSQERLRIETIVISKGTASEGRDYLARFGLSEVHLLADPDLQATYNVHTTPYAVLLDASGRTLTKGIVNNLEHLESLVRAGELDVDSIETFIELDPVSVNGDQSLNGGAS